MSYPLRDLPIPELFPAVARAGEALVRLDERLARSAVGAGWVARSHFHDATAALWLEGELVHLEDLVLHDAAMDIRTPTHELTRAHALLRQRRRVLGAARDWALSPAGLRELTGRGGVSGSDEGDGTAGTGLDGLKDGRRNIAGKADAAAAGGQSETAPFPAAADDAFAAELAAMDAALERSADILAGRPVAARATVPSPAGGRPELVYDLDWDEAGRLEEWRVELAATAGLPAVLRAALLIDAWQEIEPIQRGAALGPLLVAALLRQERVTDNHLAALSLGAQKVARERRRAASRGARVLAFVEAISEAAAAGMREHDRLSLARLQMERHLRGRRASSRLPAMIELALARPLVTTGMIQAELKVSRQGALDLVAALSLREVTGRGRYKGWAV